MNLVPLTGKYFSENLKTEKTMRITFSIAILVIAVILMLFWTPLRDTRSAYALVSFTVTSPVVLYFFRAVTILGSEGFFLVMFSIIFWSYNKALGFFGLVFMPMAIFITSEIPKDMIRLPRPDVRGVTVPTYTFPSGHTSGAVSVWGFLAIYFKKRWLWALSIMIIVLVGLSRVMLGYHFPGDVLGGIIAGSVLLVILFGLGSKLEPGILKKYSFPTLLAAAVLIPLVLSFIPAVYAPNLMGYVAGAALGFLLEGKVLNYDPRGNLWQQLLRIIIGLIVIAVVLLELEPILPRAAGLLTFTCFALSTFWVTFLAPLLFVKFGLARKM